MATFTRPSPYNYVVLTNGNSTFYFDSTYGGAPLRWTYPINGSTQDIIDPYPGTGFQVVIDQGQDLTQAGANGVTYFPIARNGIDTGADLAYKVYYAYEDSSGFPNNQNFYKVVGFFPDFWASLAGGDRDDSIPPNSSGNTQTPGTTLPSGWITGYTSPANTSSYPYSVNTWGAPVYFSPYGGGSTISGDNVFSGILMEGNAQTYVGQYVWNERLREIPDGTIAFRTKVSLSNASHDAFGGVVFRKNVPAGSNKTMDDVYNAQGYELVVNYNGDMALTYTNASGVRTTFWTYNGTSDPAGAGTQTSVRNSYGCQIEFRSFNFTWNQMLYQVWANGKLVSTPNVSGTDFSELPSNYNGVNCQYRGGKNVGLLAYTTNAYQAVAGYRNFVRFADREIVNVGTTTEITYTPLSNEGLKIEVVHAPASGVSFSTINLYTLTWVAFLNAAYQPGGVRYFDDAGIQQPVGTWKQGPSTLNYSEAISSTPNEAGYAGYYSGSSSDVGVKGIPKVLTFSSVPSSGYTANPHMQAQSYVSAPPYTNMAINSMPLISPEFSKGNTGWQMGTGTLTMEWYPKW